MNTVDLTLARQFASENAGALSKEIMEWGRTSVFKADGKMKYLEHLCGGESRHASLKMAVNIATDAALQFAADNA